MSAESNPGIPGGVGDGGFRDWATPWRPRTYTAEITEIGGRQIVRHQTVESMRKAIRGEVIPSEQIFFIIPAPNSRGKITYGSSFVTIDGDVHSYWKEKSEKHGEGTIDDHESHQLQGAIRERKRSYPQADGNVSFARVDGKVEIDPETKSLYHFYYTDRHVKDFEEDIVNRRVRAWAKNVSEIEEASNSDSGMITLTPLEDGRTFADYAIGMVHHVIVIPSTVDYSLIEQEYFSARDPDPRILEDQGFAGVRSRSGSLPILEKTSFDKSEILDP